MGYIGAGIGSIRRSLLMEEWRDISKCPGYQVSDLGRVRSLPRVTTDANGRTMRFRGKILALHEVVVKGKVSSVRITLRQKGKKNKTVNLVHHLVLDAFIGPRPAGLEGCHDDGNAAHNVKTNLRWDTRESNVEDVYRHGIRKRDRLSGLPRLRGRPFETAYLCGISGLI
jgi:hypothetical protein